MARHSIHWAAPASAVGSLAAGHLLITDHHLFYRSLHAKAVSDNGFLDFELSQQQVNIAVGTTFAFLARACMVLTVSIAFVQVFLHAVSKQSGGEMPTLQRIDSIYSLLGNAFKMCNLRSWYTYPLLMLVAGLAW